MRKVPTYLVSVFLVITLFRVALYAADAMGAGWLGWPFAVGLGLAVYASAYFTREHITVKDGAHEDRRSRSTRQVAVISLIIFTGVDGLFNLVEVLRSLPDNSDTVVVVGAWVYGLFPTLAAALLGVLQGYVDRLPVAPQKAKVSQFEEMSGLLMRRVLQLLDVQEQTLATPFVPVLHDEQPANDLKRLTCKCGWQSAKVYETERGATNAMNAHKRKCKINGKV